MMLILSHLRHKAMQPRPRSGVRARLMRRASCAIALFFALQLSCAPCSAAQKVAPPNSGVYHCAHPDFGVRDDLVTKGRVKAFERKARMPIVWAFVSWHWDKGIEFPAKQCVELNECGVIPLVAMMPWSTFEQNKAESVYTLERILNGYFDDSLRECARAVRDLGFPIMMEFGPELNGPWFPWSAAWNGRDEDRYGERGVPDGAERFRDSYRHIIDIFREEDANDVTWVFHIATEATRAVWNAASWYYPGDDYIDWLGLSVYGRLRGDSPARSFREIIKHVYDGLCDITNRPMAIIEIGVSDSPKAADKARWVEETYSCVNSGEFPRIKAISWWNKVYRPDGSRSTLEIDSSPTTLEAYRQGASGMSFMPVIKDDS